MSTIDTPSSSEAGKRIIERSAAYPAISLEEAVAFVAELSKNFPGSHPIKRDDAAAVLKQSAIHRPMAACVHYGLLERDKDEYRATELFRAIKNSLNDKERKQALLQAFGSPKLYSEIINKHDGHVIPPELRTHLIRFHKIAERAADDVADLFNKNAKYVEVLTEHNILQYKHLLSKYSDPNIQYAEVTVTPSVETKSETGTETVPLIEITQPTIQQPHAHLLNEINSEEKVRVPLTERKVAYIQYPANIKKADIEILRKQIELLELLEE